MTEQQVPGKTNGQVEGPITGPNQPLPDSTSAPPPAMPKPVAPAPARFETLPAPPLLRDTWWIVVLATVAGLCLYRTPGGRGAACLPVVTGLLLAVAAGRLVSSFDRSRSILQRVS